MSNFVSPERIEQMTQAVSAHLLRQDVEHEPQEFVLGANDGDLFVKTDPAAQAVVNQGDFLCFLDSSPRLPSSLLANHVADRVKRLSQPDQILQVVLIRAKCSKLSPKVPLDGALLLQLGNAELGMEMSEPDKSRAPLKPIDLNQI